MDGILMESISIQKYSCSLKKISGLFGKFSDNNIETNKYYARVNSNKKFRALLTIEQDYDIYSGPYEVTPSSNGEQVLHTANRLMEENVVVLEIPYFEVSNDSDGTTVFIAKEV